VFCTELLNIKFSPDIIPCWPLYNYQLSLQFTASTFTVQAVQHFKLSTIYTKYRKTLTFTNRAVLICTAASPHFTVLSVPDTRTTFNYCCSFNTLNPELNPIRHLLSLLGAYHILYVSRIRVNWKRTTNGNFVLSIITWVLDTGELLG